jgi:uncharacterized membrane protein YtjA (UPF0391 family)
MSFEILMFTFAMIPQSFGFAGSAAASHVVQNLLCIAERHA